MTRCGRFVPVASVGSGSAGERELTPSTPRFRRCDQILNLGGLGLGLLAPSTPRFRLRAVEPRLLPRPRRAFAAATKLRPSTNTDPEHLPRPRRAFAAATATFCFASGFVVSLAPSTPRFRRCDGGRESPVPFARPPPCCRAGRHCRSPTALTGRLTSALSLALWPFERPRGGVAPPRRSNIVVDFDRDPVRAFPATRGRRL